MKKTYSKPEMLLVKTQQPLLLTMSDKEADSSLPVLGRYRNKLWDDDEDDWLLDD